MTSDQENALSALAEIERAEQRTFQAVFFGISGGVLILWGAITAAGYLFSQCYPRDAAPVWAVLQGAGFVAMLVLLSRKGRALTLGQRQLVWRLVFAEVVLIVFGLLVVTLLGPFSGRQLDAFWPLVFMQGYILAGIWTGRFFIICGIVVVLLTMAGYWWSGPWFATWMAVVDGGALILGGLWLRQKGAAL